MQRKYDQCIGRLPENNQRLKSVSANRMRIIFSGDVEWRKE